MSGRLDGTARWYSSGKSKTDPSSSSVCGSGALRNAPAPVLASRVAENLETTGYFRVDARAGAARARARAPVVVERPSIVVVAAARIARRRRRRLSRASSVARDGRSPRVVARAPRPSPRGSRARLDPRAEGRPSRGDRSPLRAAKLREAMARAGEGDARWIVEDRADGTNVHGWHWQEKDALPWARARLDALCARRAIDGDGDGDGDGVVTRVAVTGVTKCEGEAYVNKRKGKIIPGYELELEMSYVAELRDGKTRDGKIRLPYVADENADEDPECVVVPANDTNEDARVKALILKSIVPKVLEGVRTWVKEMAAGGPGGDAPASAEAAAEAAEAAEAAKAAKAKSSASVPRSDKTAPLSQTNHTIRLTENFYCRPRDICDALLDGNRVQHFTQSRASGLNGSTGKFEMFDGNVQGETTEYVPGEKIVQNWRFSSWPDDHFSVVTVTFREPEPGNCFVDLVQTNVPECDKFGNETVMDTTENGWKNLIFGRIRQVFGYGA
jgi:activator of HSP90 ATPase